MNLIHRWILPHGSMLLLSLGLAGCSSSDSAVPSQSAPGSAVTNVPAPQTPQMGHNMAPMNAQAGANKNANMSDPAAMMRQQHGGGTPGTNPNAPPSNDQMAAMMKQNMKPPGAHGGTPGNTAPNNDQMAAMMKQNMRPPGGPGGSAPGNTTPSNEQMAAMMKQNMPAAPGLNQGANPAMGGNMAGMMRQQHGGAAAGAGPPGNTTPSNEQMAAMMKQNMGAGMQPPGGPGSGRGGRGSGNRNGMNGAMAGANLGQGRGPGGAGGQFAEGSIDDVLKKFLAALEEGDTAKASEYISPKAKGVLAGLRDGHLSEEKIAEITELVSPVSELQPGQQITENRRNLINGKQQSMTFVLKKEKDVYKITEMTLPKKKSK